ncbi:hypothetical protein [Gloeobacter morelensis]|uniref:Uncharacterized protein n=1 Tax=Gloeobacter morelensis MG652769 TaxID=2781736 RepID=A0ABY3PGU4_9CYAN|nr:hypothetical protein [Gloeobacter morelensis]UFP92891.1 hypothetical protein ISF26_13775 [Gloeobacter morelensis MG652769]
MKSFLDSAGRVDLVLGLLKGDPAKFFVALLVLVNVFTSKSSRRLLFLIYGYDVYAVDPWEHFWIQLRGYPWKAKPKYIYL